MRHATEEPAGKTLTLNRAEVVDHNFLDLVSQWPEAQSLPGRPGAELLRPGGSMTCGDLRELFESQMIARHQDIESRSMRARNTGFYTIGSAGHEGNAVLGRLTRRTDPAFLHYRSGALLAERARQLPAIDFVRDTMLSFAASADDPISGGRHKVWGSAPLWVFPQTSTIASHLPKAVGTAFFLRRAAASVAEFPLPKDSIVLCSFGDASVNHASAQTAFNAAAWATFQGLPLPLLFVCEDNEIGISVATPKGWVESSISGRGGLKYFAANGLDIEEASSVAAEAVDYCRDRRAPVFLHLRTVRLLGHAGTDAEHGYRSWEQIEAAEAQDPLLHTARLVLQERVMTPAAVLDLYEAVRSRVKDAARQAEGRPRLTSAAEVVAPLAPCHAGRVNAEARRAISPEIRARHFGGEDRMPENQPSKHLAALINLGLRDLMLKYPESVLFGEDVARKGGVYNVTTGLEAAMGTGRVFNTLLDETTILGLAIGAGQLGLLPIPEIQYLAYYHNAEDQIRGEAASLQFFSNGQFRNPMVVRVQGWSYQKGFGGHFHNDNSIAAMRDVPGLVIATPSRGDDAVKMMRTLMALAKVDGRVCIMIEPIALYMTKDLYEAKDGAWQFAYPAPGEAIALGEAGITHPEAKDLTILTFANGLHMSLRAAKTLVEQHGVSARVVDLRWLNPLNEGLILEQARATGKALVVDEGRRAGGVAEAILALLAEQAGPAVIARRLNALDTFVPLGPAADLVLPQVDDVVKCAVEMVGG